MERTERMEVRKVETHGVRPALAARLVKVRTRRVVSHQIK
jgi:hypothetical protein